MQEGLNARKEKLGMGLWRPVCLFLGGGGCLWNLWKHSKMVLACVLLLEAVSGRVAQQKARQKLGDAESL